MPRHSEGPGIWLSVWRFLLTHCFYERAVKVLARLRGCAGSPEPLLLAYAISTKFAWRGPYNSPNIYLVNIHALHYFNSNFSKYKTMTFENCVFVNVLYFFFIDFCDESFIEVLIGSCLFQVWTSCSGHMACKVEVPFFAGWGECCSYTGSLQSSTVLWYLLIQKQI